jgi:hypothetical protein
MYSIHAPGLPAIVLPAFAVAGYHGVVIFLILLASAACALAWWLSWRTTGSASAAWFGWTALTFSAPFLLESYTVFPDAPGGRDRPDRFLGLVEGGPRGRRPRGTREIRGPRGRFMDAVAVARRGAGDAAVAAHAVRRARGHSRRAYPGAAGARAQRLRESERVSGDSRRRRARMAGILPRHLRHARPDRSLRWRRRQFTRVSPERTRRIALRPGFRIARDGARARHRLRRACEDAPIRPGVAGRRGSVSACGRHLPDVVGRVERAGAFPCAAAPAARNSGGDRMGSDQVARCPSGDAHRASRHRVALGGDGGRRRRAARLSHAKRRGPDRRAVPRVGEPHRRSAGGISRVRAATRAARSGWTRVAPARRALGVRGHADLGTVSRSGGVSHRPLRPRGIARGARSGGNADARVGRDARDISRVEDAGGGGP